jgi:hypothetical protein
MSTMSTTKDVTMSEKLPSQILMYQIQFLSMHACQATTHNYKSAEFGILEFFPGFWEKNYEKWHGF